jgi:transposase-like protein
MNGQVTSKPTQRRYSEELKDRAVRMVCQLREETGERHGGVKRVADQLDIGVESLRSWVKQHDIDHGERPGTTTEDGLPSSARSFSARDQSVTTALGPNPKRAGQVGSSYGSA